MTTVHGKKGPCPPFHIAAGKKATQELQGKAGFALAFLGRHNCPVLTPGPGFFPAVLLTQEICSSVPDMASGLWFGKRCSRLRFCFQPS